MVEVGGGAGTNAQHVCQYLHEHLGPRGDWRYTVLEISSELATRQRERLATWVEAGRLTVLNVDASEVPAAKNKRETCVVVCLEVFDNLPHDKVIRDEDGTWNEAIVMG